MHFWKSIFREQKEDSSYRHMGRFKYLKPAFPHVPLNVWQGLPASLLVVFDFAASQASEDQGVPYLSV